MSTELEKRALAIFETALGREGSERERFLAEACRADGELRLRVETLFRAHAKKGSFLGSSPVESETAIREELVAGQRFGAYSILGALGRGGMGEVYLAQDSRLGRKVALKLLRSEHTRDPERMKRFELEARAASALNHPNLLTVHEIGEEGSRRFMASEYVEGRTLREILSTRKMTLSEAVDVGVQVASALGAAHEAGVVHRDVTSIHTAQPCVSAKYGTHRSKSTYHLKSPRTHCLSMRTGASTNSRTSMAGVRSFSSFSGAATGDRIARGSSESCRKRSERSRRKEQSFSPFLSTARRRRNVGSSRTGGRSRFYAKAPKSSSSTA